jgi:hypothetical protein
MAPHIARLRDLQDELEILNDGLKESVARAKISPCTCVHGVHDEETGRCSVDGCNCRRPDFSLADYRKISEVAVSIQRLTEEQIKPAALRLALVEVSGLTIDGNANPTADDILELAGDDFVSEISSEIETLLGLRGNAAKNSESPTTSGAPAGGAMSLSGVPSASAGDCI